MNGGAFANYFCSGCAEQEWDIGRLGKKMKVIRKEFAWKIREMNEDKKATRKSKKRFGCN